MKTGIELITEERQKQIDKHGFTAEHHANNPQWYEENQLSHASELLLHPDTEDLVRPMALKGTFYPTNWNKEWFVNLMNKSEKERLIIAGALIAAELDRLEYIENQTVEQ